MTPGTTHAKAQKLRKRRIVIAGHGTSVVAFCNRFKSDWAEITVVSPVSDYAPQVVRHGIAAGHLLPEVFCRLLRVRFSKHKHITFVTDEVVGIDATNRSLDLRDSDKPLAYDYLLIGNQVVEHQELHLNTCADAKSFAAKLRRFQKTPSLRINGADAAALDMAATFTKSSTKRLGNATPAKVILDCLKGFEFPNFEVTAKTENRFAKELRWESISLLDQKTAAAFNDDSLRLSASQPLLPDWLPIETNGNRNKRIDPEAISKHIRPDLRLRSDERVYLMPELVRMMDSVGKTLVAEDHVWMQQGMYLATLLKGIIEARKRSLVDPPGFVLKNSSSFATIRKWKSIGFSGRRALPSPMSFLIDLVSVKLPVFNLAYGRFAGFGKLLQWLGACK